MKKHSVRDRSVNVILQLTSASPKTIHCPANIKAAYKGQSRHCESVFKYISSKAFSNRLLGRFMISEKIQPNVRQHFSVMNVPDEKEGIV